MTKTEQKIPVFDKVADIGYSMRSLCRTLKYSVLTLIHVLFFF